MNVYGNIHAGKSIRLKIPEWTSMAHRYSVNSWMFMYFQLINDSSWISHGYFNLLFDQYLLILPQDTPTMKGDSKSC